MLHTELLLQSHKHKYHVTNLELHVAIRIHSKYVFISLQETMHTESALHRIGRIDVQ